MTCLDCGYMLSAFDKECPRCKQYAARGLKPPSGLKIPADIDPEPVAPEPIAIAPPQKVIRHCDQCGAALNDGARYCAACAAPASAAERMELTANHLRSMSPSIGTIFFMWTLGFVAIFLVAASDGNQGAVGLAVLLDLVAVILAIVLACNKSPTDKTNGKIYLILELISFVIGFIRGNTMN